MEQEKWEIFRILFQISFVIRICYRNVKMCIHSRFWMSLVNTFNLMQECYTVLYSILCFFCQQSVKRLIKLRICEPFQQSVWSVDCYFLRLPFPTVIKKKKIMWDYSFYKSLNLFVIMWNDTNIIEVQCVIESRMRY